METRILLLVLNLFFGIVNYKMRNYKTSAFSFFACGALSTAILNDLFN